MQMGDADWCVTINSQKTVATCFSLSNTKATFKLTVNNQELPKEERTYTWASNWTRNRPGVHTVIKEVKKKATKRLSLMKKLSGTKWGASSNTLKRNVRPVMEYGAAAWATAKKEAASTIWLNSW